MAENIVQSGSSEDRSSISSKESDLEMESMEACAAAVPLNEENPGKMDGLEQKPTLEDGIDRLLQRHRSDIMFELRRLTHGERPVTGQENRKNVEDFFTRNLNPEASDPRAQEENRPESVIVEVRGLVESRPVSSVLQSAGFRRNLERALRGSLSAISSRQPTQQTTARRPNDSRAAPQPTASNANSRSNTPEMAQAARPPIDSSNDRLHDVLTSSSRSNSRESSPGQERTAFVQQLQNAHLRRQQRVAGNANNVAPIPPAPSPALPPVRPEEYAEAWLQGHVGDNQNQREQEGMSLWDNMEQAHREYIISDISELVQRQLVTSTLEGEFRNTLEVNMRNRLEASGIDGTRVQRVINQLPRIPAHMRNNFSDLGIGGPQGLHNPDNLSDNVSVISATAAVTIPQSQSTAVMSREINSLKSQMEELKNMMKLSFDLQLDIQRAIRQEVAAAVAGALGGGGAACASAHQREPVSRPVDSTKCVICLDKSADAVLYQCGHLCLCYTCGLTIKQRGSNCPVCRAPIKDIIRAYTTGNSD